MSGSKRWVPCVGLATAWLVVAGPVRADYVIDSFFDVWTELTVGPPYPTAPPIGIRAYEDPGMSHELAHITLAMNVTPPEPMTTGAVDSGGGGGGGKIVTITQTAPQGLAAGALSPNMHFSFTNPGGSPITVNPGPVYFCDSFFDVWTELSLSDGSTMINRMHGELNVPGHFTDVDTSGHTIDSFFDVFFEIEIPTPVPPNQPVVTVTMTGSTPEPASAALLLLGTIALLRRR